ncbi:MAG TPA: SAF domain-containing protein [Myxococcaceae bacterium]
MKTILLWFLVGLGLSSVGVAGFILFTHSGRVARAREGWDLKPVIVVSRDVPEGRALTYDDLTQRLLPSKFLTESVVTPADAARVVGRAPSMPLKQGDWLLWAAFTDYSATDECFVSIAPKVDDARARARHEALARFETQNLPVLREPGQVPVPQAEASGEVAVVVLKARVAAGQVLQEPMLEIGKRPQGLVTASFVPADQLREVAGARLLIPLEANDALMWQMLDDAQRPRRVFSCMSEVGNSMNEAHERARREEAAAFVSAKEAR